MTPSSTTFSPSNAAPALLGHLLAHAVRTAKYSQNRDHPLAASTVRDTVSALSVAFAENDRDNPVLNSQGKTHRILQLQFTSYHNDDPAAKSQRALTLDFILKVFMEQRTPVDCCFGPLLILAFFFALRAIVRIP
jgi:hypothetical protein